jgi:type I restriction enzyme, S subunit
MGMESVWPTTKLGELAAFRNGVNFNKSSFGEGIKVIGVGDFQDYTKPRYDGLGQINPEGIITERNILKDGDIIFVRSNGNRNLIGRSLYIQQPPEEITHSAFTIRLRFTSPDVVPLFYAYCFRTPLIRKGLTAFGGGTNISNLNQDILSALEVPQPPVAMQQKIADILTSYDELMENNRRRIQLLETAIRRLYREWFVKFRYPGHEANSLVQSKDRRIPKGWEPATIRNLASFIGRGISPSYDDEGISTVINQKCIRDQRLDLSRARRQTKEISPEKLVRFGDVLINSTGVGTLGRVAQVYKTLDLCTVDSHVTIARPIDSISADFFGSALLESESEFERLGTGSTGQTELSRDSIAQIELLKPPTVLQKEFGAIVRPMRQAVIAYTNQIHNLRQTRDLLIPRLLSGQTLLEAH